MGKIAVLNQATVNMIAAGEVIERPASVVKELLENSIDAGAKTIRVDVEDGGRRLIRIVDDGCGMAADDLALAFEPHATSKIRAVDDLARIVTLGFRGEALASIAAVAKVVAVSRPPEAMHGHRIEIDCGDKSPIQPCAADVGTTIEVRHLFYKLPARQKFLRAAATEFTHISEQFIRIALAFDQLDLTLTHNGRQVYHLLSGQPLSERLAALFGDTIGVGLISASRAGEELAIKALLGKPDLAKSSAGYQYVFLNRRYIRDKFIQHAIKEAYRGLVEPNKFPVVFLFLQMPPDAFDVNVHPTKIEVRFANPNRIYSEVLAVLREKLLSVNLDVSAKLDGAGRDEIDKALGLAPLTEGGIDPQRRARIEKAMADFFKTHAPADQPQIPFRSAYPADKPKPVAGRTGHFISPPAPAMATQPADSAEPTAIPSTDILPAQTSGSKFLQIDNTYLIVPQGDGFVVIDQHALHERILYQQLADQLQRGGPLASQRLLMPLPFDATPRQLEQVELHAELLTRLGIEIIPFGKKTLAVQAFPTLLKYAEPTEFVSALLDRLAGLPADAQPEQLLEEMLQTAACKAAIKAGQALSDQEIEQLLAARQATLRASRCPHGRPAVLVFSRHQLEKQFKRTGGQKD